MKKLLAGIRKFCVFLFWPQKTDKNRYDDRNQQKTNFSLDPSVGNFGCVVPAGAWHTVEVLEPSVIFEAKDGKYGEDGSETKTN